MRNAKQTGYSALKKSGAGKAISSAQASAASLAAGESKAGVSEQHFQNEAETFSCPNVTPKMLAAGVRAYWDACFFDSHDELEIVQQEIVKQIYIAMCKAITK